jgi:hypothetical protein
MVPRHFVVAVPVVLALGLGVTSASAQQPAPVTASAAPAIVSRAPLPADHPGDLVAGSVISDGQIYDLVRDGDRLYAVGGFQTIGHYSGAGGVVDGTTAAAVAGPVLGDGQVSVSVSDGAGGWYVGGDFTSIDGQATGGLAHVLADHTLDPAFLPVTNGLVSALALQGTTLYVGGDFGKVGDQARKHLAAISTVDGSVLSLNAPQAERVTEIAVSPTALYVGSDRVVALDPVTGAAIPTFTSPAHDPGGVHALTLGGGHLYVGTDRLVVLDPTTGAVDPTFDPPSSPQDYRSFHALLWTDSVLYAGSDRAARLMALDPDTGALMPGFAPLLGGQDSTFGAPGGVYDLALDGDRLWAGGSFTSAGGEPARNLAVFDAATGDRIETDLPAYNQQVNAVELSGGDVYVGGTFYMTDWIRSNSVAVLDADTLEPDPAFQVKRYAYGEPILSPSALYLTPNHFQGFDKRDGSPHLYYPYTSRIRAFDPDTGAVLPALTRSVRNLTGATTIGDRLYVARRLENDVRFPRNRVDVYNAAGHRVDTFLLPLRGYVTTLTTVDGDLVAAGSFKRSTRAGFPRNTAIIRLNPANGARRPGFDPHINGPVYDVVAQDGSLFASGLFKQVLELADSDRPGLTKLSAGSHQDGTFDPAGFGGNRVLIRLHVAGDLLFVDGGPQRLLDATTGEQVAPLGGPGTSASAVVTAPGGGYSYAAGLSPNLGGRTYRPIGYISPAGR